MRSRLRSGVLLVLTAGAAACSDLIGLNDYETVDELETAGTAGSGGSAGSNAGTAGTGAAGVGGGGTAGTGGVGGTGGSGGMCIPTASTATCTRGDQCCEFATDRALCVNFQERGAFCAPRCTGNASCASKCCVGLENGGNACGFAELCPIGAPCALSGEACPDGTCNGAWCTKECTRSPDCPGLTWCIANTAGTNTCFPGCTTNADCTAYPGTQCLAANDIGGIATHICSLP